LFSQGSVLCLEVRNDVLLLTIDPSGEEAIEYEQLTLAREFGAGLGRRTQALLERLLEGLGRGMVTSQGVVTRCAWRKNQSVALGHGVAVPGWTRRCRVATDADL